MNNTIDEEIGQPQSLRQPPALYLLVIVQMWECFSFYGMRALLVLYMISEMQYTDIRAFGVYAVYSGLVDLGSVLGGIIADKMLGLRRAISIGGWLIAAGHITMAFDLSGGGLFVGLALIVIGSSLFSTNISALLGLFYKPQDARREEGYTLFYMSINIGALLASLVCGAVGEYYGWHYGFGLAAIGMIIGNIAMMIFNRLLEDKGMVPARLNRTPRAKILEKLLMPLGLCLAVYIVATAIFYGGTILPLLPFLCIACIGYIAWKIVKSGSIPKGKIIMLVVYLAALAIFYAAEEQIGSSLMLLGERHGKTALFDIEIPASLLLGVNPATIMLIGPFINRICRIFQTGKSEFPYRLVTAFVLASIAFAGIAFACAYPDRIGQISMLSLVCGIVIISGAELLVGPAVYSYCSEIAPEDQQGAVMGLVPMGFSLASFCGGGLSAMMAVPEEAIDTSLSIYTSGYSIIAIMLIGTAVILAVVIPMIQRRSKSTELNTKIAVKAFS
jgi:POT family proton-dependent oligopeptide transporter